MSTIKELKYCDYIDDVTVEEDLNRFLIKIKLRKGGMNSVGEFPFTSEEEKKTIKKYAEKYAEKIKNAIVNTYIEVTMELEGRK